MFILSWTNQSLWFRFFFLVWRKVEKWMKYFWNKKKQIIKYIIKTFAFDFDKKKTRTTSGPYTLEHNLRYSTIHSIFTLNSRNLAKTMHNNIQHTASILDSMFLFLEFSVIFFSKKSFGNVLVFYFELCDRLH